MNPVVLQQLSRLGPVLSRVLARGGSFATPFWKTSQIDVPEVTAQPVAPGGAPAVHTPSSTDNTRTPANYSAGDSPQDRLKETFGMFPNAMSPMSAPSPLDTAQWPYGPMGAPQGTTPPQPASVPMPQARPAEAPQAPPEMSFFQRNAAMMRDPGTDQFIDPMAAAQAQAVRGPDLINKMMAFLHNKDTA